MDYNTGCQVRLEKDPDICRLPGVKEDLNIGVEKGWSAGS
jgi:hypothetical protein